MRPPLDVPMRVRTEAGDARYRGKPGIHHLGQSSHVGAWGNVRPGPHAGWDIYAPVNTLIKAVADGVIVQARHHKGYGRTIILQIKDAAKYSKQSRDSKELFALYAHLSHFAVSEGQPVKEGQILGHTGTDGNAAGHPQHLHFEIRTSLDLGHKLHGTLDPKHFWPHAVT